MTHSFKLLALVLATLYIFSPVIQAQENLEDFLYEDEEQVAELPGLVLEETEDGWIVENWEDQGARNEEPLDDWDEGLILEEAETGWIVENWQESASRDEEEFTEEGEGGLTLRGCK